MAEYNKFSNFPLYWPPRKNSHSGLYGKRKTDNGSFEVGKKWEMSGKKHFYGRN
jgi:hypothetical protein